METIATFRIDPDRRGSWHRRSRSGYFAAQVMDDLEKKFDRHQFTSPLSVLHEELLSTKTLIVSSPQPTKGQILRLSATGFGTSMLRNRTDTQKRVTMS